MAVSQTTLAHEKGAGAACRVCGPKCEGLDLHFWRKICKICKCKLEDHEVKIEDFNIQHSILKNLLTLNDGTTVFQRSKLALSQLEASPAEIEAAKKNFMFMPEGTNPQTISKYMAALPKEKAPHLTEEGFNYRQKQLLQQLPAHDFDDTYCDDLSDKEKQKMKDFNRKRNEEASGQGAIKEHVDTTDRVWDCVNCNQKLHAGDVAIFAERAGPDKCWHPECFVCSTCNELLVDLIYFYKDGNIYCGRHYGELTRVRCAACDELIFTKEYTQAEGRSWHIKHFCCYECDKELGGQRYVAKDDHPYCLDCYGRKYAKVCNKCHDKIPPDAKRVTYKELHWHASEACFNCNKCIMNLLGKQFIFKNNNVFCSADCARSFSSGR